ncbi:LysR family transcriptional regulator [Nocardia callitridis]|uniref:LysR family transcriptional regulator n=1 Tax=Nocardia callitridis TaxID=648753 RepID=A0ABP9KNZ2_9NOCA
MELQQLRYFVTVSEQGSISAAATLLRASQTTISESLQALERNVGTPLFFRLGSGMSLTSAGYALLSTARRVTRMAAATPWKIRRGEDTMPDRLTVCLIDSTASGAGVRCIARFLRAHPRASVVTKRAPDPTEAADLVHRGVADVAFVVVTPGAARTNELDSLHIDTETVLAVYPPGSTVSAEAVSLAALTEQPLVLTSAESDVYPALAEHFSLLRSPQRVPVRASRREDRLGLVAAGLGASLVTDRDRVRAEHVGAVVRPLRPVLDRDVLLLWEKDRETGVVQEFVDLCRAEAQMWREAASHA